MEAFFVVSARLSSNEVREQVNGVVIHTLSSPCWKFTIGKDRTKAYESSLN